MNNKLRSIGNSIVLLIFLINIIIPGAFAEQHAKYETATVYYNEACSMCAEYIQDELLPTLKELGIKDIVKKDYINEKKNRIELNKINDELSIPPNLQGHFVIILENNSSKIILGGHVPKQVIVDLLTKEAGLDRLLVLQDKMDDAKSYFAWGFKGEAKEYDINTPISEYIGWFDQNKGSLKGPDVYDGSWDFKKLFPLVAISGFLDGLNPCAFAVLFLFVAFLFTLGRASKDIILIGFLYISMIYLAYLLIGLGLIHTFIFAGQEHLITQLSAWMVIIMGLINIKDYFWYGKWFTLSPHINNDFYKKWVHKLTIPSVMIAGFLVGLCTFPCSGGIYVAILALLSNLGIYFDNLLTSFPTALIP